MDRKREMITGIVVVGVVVLIVVAILFVDFNPGQTFYVDFGDAAKLKRGDTVYLKGMDVGEVLDVGFQDPKTVRVKLKITGLDSLSARSTFLITNDKLLVSKKCVKVYIFDPEGPPIEKDGVYQGVDSYIKLFWAMLKHKTNGVIKTLGDFLGKGSCELVKTASDGLDALCDEEEEGILVEIRDCLRRGVSWCSAQTGPRDIATLTRMIAGCLISIGIEEGTGPVQED